MKKRKQPVFMLFIYFLIFSIFVELISFALVNTGHYSRGAVEFNIFEIFIPFLIPLVIVISFLHACCLQSKIYEMEVKRAKKVYLSVFAFIGNVLTAKYGTMRVFGGYTAFQPLDLRSGMSFAWDTCGVSTTSSGEFSGCFILLGCFASTIGLIVSHIFRCLYNRKSSVVV